METPNKKLEISSMTHEEEEEMQHNISKLRDQVEQISLAPIVIEAKMDGLKKDVEAKIYDVEAKMDGLRKDIEAKINDMEHKMDGVEAKLDDLKKGMEDLKTYLKADLTKFLQKIITKGKMVVK